MALMSEAELLHRLATAQQQHAAAAYAAVLVNDRHKAKQHLRDSKVLASRMLQVLDSEIQRLEIEDMQFDALQERIACNDAATIDLG